MGSNMNCESCSRNTRTQMDMRGQKSGMTDRYAHGAMSPRVQGGCNECGTSRVSRDCDDCHRDMDVLRGKHLAMAYVPWQEFGCTYEPMQGLQVGTIFPELDKPFLAYGRRGMK